MRCHGLVVVWCLGMIIYRFHTAESGLAGLRGPAGVKVGIRYCKVNPTIAAFLKQIQFKRKPVPSKGSISSVPRRPGSVFAKNRNPRSAIRWPYNCKHTALNYEKLVFEHDTYTCCMACNSRDFSQCVTKYGRLDGMVRCPSNAMRCIVKCIYKTISQGKGQAGKPGTAGKPGPKGDTGGTKCSTTKKKVGKSYCFERSCIPFKI